MPHINWDDFMTEVLAGIVIFASTMGLMVGAYYFLRWLINTIKQAIVKNKRECSKCHQVFPSWYGKSWFKKSQIGDSFVTSEKFICAMCLFKTKELSIWNWIYYRIAIPSMKKKLELNENKDKISITKEEEDAMFENKKQMASVDDAIERLKRNKP